MKPLLSQPVKRGERLDVWESSEHQATLDGLMDFRARQEERRKRVQADFDEAKQKVAQLKGRK